MKILILDDAIYKQVIWNKNQKTYEIHLTDALFPAGLTVSSLKNSLKNRQVFPPYNIIFHFHRKNLNK